MLNSRQGSICRNVWRCSQASGGFVKLQRCFHFKRFFVSRRHNRKELNFIRLKNESQKPFNESFCSISKAFIFKSTYVFCSQRFSSHHSFLSKHDLKSTFRLAEERNVDSILMCSRSIQLQNKYREQIEAEDLKMKLAAAARTMANSYGKLLRDCGKVDG
jgi:hypothetical protein